MATTVKRVYEPPSRSDGARVLVDRLWPRGLSKARAGVDEWLRDLAPSDDLRRWYHARPDHCNRRPRTPFNGSTISPTNENDSRCSLPRKTKRTTTPSSSKNYSTECASPRLAPDLERSTPCAGVQPRSDAGSALH